MTEENLEDKFDNCPICTDLRRVKTWVVCSKCSFACCRGCVKKFLLEIPDINPRCMSCKFQWDFEFVANNTDDKFHNQEYRDRRAKILVDRERSLLPGTQHLVAREKKKRDAKKELADITKEIKIYQEFLKEALKRKIQLRDQVYSNNSESPSEEKKVTRFIGHCPKQDCKGFLDTHYVCGICEGKACRSCRLEKHEGDCDKDTVETVRLLAKDTKSCPGCKIPIFKISGCSQMFCTTCRTAWDWDSGKIETGRIHNPHYYEFMRDNGGLPREAGDVRCGGLVPERQIMKKLDQYGLEKKLIKWVMNAYRLSGHIRAAVLPMHRVDVFGEHTNQDLRVSYLLGEIEEKDLTSRLKQREKKREKDNAISLVLRMFVDTLDDIMGNIAVCEMDDIPTFLIQMKQLRSYVSKNLTKIQTRFQNKVPIIDKDWSVQVSGNRKVNDARGLRV